ncbi:MAG: thiamine phosphate synthase [Pseudomonadota bacterium]
MFYPVLPDADWIERLVPCGVQFVQLRLKDAGPDDIARQIDRSLAVCAAHQCVLVVNDYWRAAIKAGAPFVHLGQEDLVGARLDVIKASGIGLGLSSHDGPERRTALAADPHYIALGPVYETKLKKMKWEPQGLERVSHWRRSMACPLVAIGGITLERADAVMEAGADMIAVVTDLVTSPEPEKRTADWVAWAERRQQSSQGR